MGKPKKPPASPEASPIIIESREASTRFSDWEQYLCLRKGDVLPYRLFIGADEFLADADDYIDEDTGEHKLPKKSFHSFRHTMVTMLQGNDVPEDVRMMIVGHSNPDVHKIYSHDEEAAIKSAIHKLPKLTG